MSTLHSPNGCCGCWNRTCASRWADAARQRSQEQRARIISLRFACLGSGSRGNATLIESGATCVLLDCGFSLRETEQRLARLGKSVADLSAVLITHEHNDHVSGAAALARRHGVPVWATLGTATAARLRELDTLKLLSAHDTLAIGDFEISPYPVPHDAREPCQYTFSDGAVRLGVITDAGTVTAHMVEMLSGCDALLLECNHDEALLDASAYPPRLKQRIKGRFGHLSNTQSAQLLAALETHRLQHLVAAHLSEQNNTPRQAQQALSEVLGCAPDWVAVADQDNGLDWRSVA